MHPMGMPCIYTWFVATLIAIVSAVVYLIRLITKKNRKTVKRVFWIANAVAIGAFVVYGITSPITRCDHEYTMILDQPATCTSDGKKEQYCPLCEYTKREKFDATGHKMVLLRKQEATYEANGELVEKCSDCGYEVVTKIDKLIQETKPLETPPIETQSVENTHTETKSTVKEPEVKSPKETLPALTEPSSKSKTDKEIAKEVSDSIANIGTVALHKEDEILQIKERYDQLSKKQKRYVKNADILNTCLKELEDLHILEQLKDDPTYTLKSSDLIGIWKGRGFDSRAIPYYYFAADGNIYYLTSNRKPEQAWFAKEYLMGNQFEFGVYDIPSAQMTGDFFCTPLSETIHFSVSRDSEGWMVMEVARKDGSEGTGTFDKTYISVDGRKSDTGNRLLCYICEIRATKTYTSPYTNEEELCCEDCYKEIMEILSRKDSEKKETQTKSKYCVVCRGNAQYSYTNPFSGVKEPYCYTHYKEIKDTMSMMEDDVKKSSQSNQNTNTNSYSGSSARHTDSEAFTCAKAIVKSSLKSPSTAKFCRITDATITHLGNGEYKVTGWVEAQNSFGATLRQNFVVVYTATKNGYKNGTVKLS